MRSRNSAVKPVSKPFVDSSATAPFPGKISGLFRTHASGAIIWRAFQKLRTSRRFCWATAVQIRPCTCSCLPLASLGRDPLPGDARLPV